MQALTRAMCPVCKRPMKQRPRVAPPKGAEKWEKHCYNIAIGQAQQLQYGQWGRDAALGITLIFWLPRPPSVPVSQRPLPNVRPDNDNLHKPVVDAMETKPKKDKAGLYLNDGQFVDTIIRKRYADDGRPVGCTVRIWEVNPTEWDYDLPFDLGDPIQLAMNW